MTAALDTPGLVMQRLEEIERDLAERQNDLENAAREFYRLKRDKERTHAHLFLQAEGTVAERQAHASLQTAAIGAEAEAEFEALKAVVRVLADRASIGMALLKSHGRYER